MEICRNRSPAGGAAWGICLPGSRLAGYRLGARIGQGGMAVVYRAMDEQLGRVVALKVLSPALSTDEEFRQRFIRESRAAAAVDDPHIIPVYGAGEADGVLYIAMRYVAGGDVRDFASRFGATAIGQGGGDRLAGGVSAGCRPCGRPGAPGC